MKLQSNSLNKHLLCFFANMLTPLSPFSLHPTGDWTQSLTDANVNEQCNKILNKKRFMLDMLFSQSPAETDKCEEERGDQVLFATSLASRISTLEAHRQVREENLKKMEVGDFDNQGSVRAVAERFGDLVKGLMSPSEADSPGREPQSPQAAGASPSPPKKESDYIWDQLMAAPRELRIKEMDFTDLGEGGRPGHPGYGQRDRLP